MSVWPNVPIIPTPEEAKLQRVEEKLDLILAHLGIKYGAPPKEKWQKLADAGPALKIQAIKEHRTQTGSSLKEAKDAVERYQDGCYQAPPAASGNGAAPVKASSKEEWQKLADEGQKIDAIKKCRVDCRIGLREAKDTVERYLMQEAINRCL